MMQMRGPSENSKTYQISIEYFEVKNGVGQDLPVNDHFPEVVIQTLALGVIASANTRNEIAAIQEPMTRIPIRCQVFLLK